MTRGWSLTQAVYYLCTWESPAAIGLECSSEMNPGALERLLISYEVRSGTERFMTQTEATELLLNQDASRRLFQEEELAEFEGSYLCVRDELTKRLEAIAAAKTLTLREALLHLAREQYGVDTPIYMFKRLGKALPPHPRWLASVSGTTIMDSAAEDARCEDAYHLLTRLLQEGLVEGFASGMAIPQAAWITGRVNWATGRLENGSEDANAARVAPCENSPQAIKILRDHLEGALRRATASRSIRVQDRPSKSALSSWMADLAGDPANFPPKRTLYRMAKSKWPGATERFVHEVWVEVAPDSIKRPGPRDKP